MKHRFFIWVLAFLLIGSRTLDFSVFAADDDWDEELSFDDSPLSEGIDHPDWFKNSFLDLRDDLQDSLKQGKWGLAVYFGQRHCAYCKALMEVDFGKEDIAHYTQEQFEVVALDIWGSREVTDFAGVTLSEREFAVREKANFTPTLIFYDRNGQPALKLPGYHPPYKFRAALKYLVEGYAQRESFRDYLLRADPPAKFDLDDLNDEPFFAEEPYLLDRSRFAADKPLLVIFEQGECHACDILHSGPLQDAKIRQLLEQFEVVQLHMFADTPLLTPSGEKLTAHQWAEKLRLFYTPTLLLFDEHGKEIIRVDSVAHLYRLTSVLTYVLEKGYLQQPDFMQWRGEQRQR